MFNPEPQDQPTRGTNINPLCLSISFLDRRKDGVKRSWAVPVTEADLHRFWLDKHLLTVLTPAYIIYSSLTPEPQGLTTQPIPQATQRI